MQFERAEYDVRLTKTKERMEARGIDVLITVDPANMCYLTGYDGWSFYVPQCVVLAVDEPEPIWIGRKMDVNAAHVTTYLKQESVIGYPDDYVQSITKHPFDYVADKIAERGWDNRTIGVEMDNYYFTAQSFFSLQYKLPNARFQDLYSLVNWVRSVKSEAEVDYMRQAARIIENVMRTAIDAIEPGVRQCDAVAHIYHAQITGTPEFGGDYTAIVPMLPTGEGTSTPHLTWSDKPFVEGEATILELAGCRRRYHCPQARTMFLGEPPQKLTDATKWVLEGMEAALAAVRPGILCEDVEAAWRECVAKYGLTKDSRIGYSTGLNYPPDWGEHTMSLRPGDRTELEPNMCFHMILGIWMDDWGLEISETFRVTETGAECLANVPRDLVVKA
ncbi:M24 family metallopeptidase [Ferruginivarius sediminum]|uniref:M24 family metallopeptidase n=1 Tax=Ferruginivarius sediminum TaxID=2661937 RepID=A0A369T9Z1_9PROT|nr:M24 family metallopeptidase [Ferruginivarius sediminum]RDD61195.1 M24 family metallopeptidase [Ferruginivarius sediminum]